VKNCAIKKKPCSLFIAEKGGQGKKKEGRKAPLLFEEILS
jgi:hypothetical protein